jgi:tRNA(Ile)-lysidine synthase
VDPATSRSPRGLATARPNPRDATLEHAAGRLLTARRLLPEAGPLLVGVSGGPDSMGLLHLLAAHRERTGLPAEGLHVAHVNHRLRGADSDTDAAFVRGTAGALGLPFSEASVEPGVGEERARALRYGALAAMAAAAGASRLAVAHTADDQAETILFRLVRGAGLRGLSGMRSRGRVHGLEVVRPLLTSTREQVLDYLRRHGVAYRLDATNESLDPSRNFLRHEVLPRLRERLNPAVRDALLRSGALMAEADAYLEARARRAFPRVLRSREPGKITLDAGALLLYPKVLQKYLFRCALRELNGEVLDLSASHIEALLSLLRSTTGSSADIPGGVRARRDRGGVLRLIRTLEPQVPEGPSKTGVPRPDGR